MSDDADRRYAAGDFVAGDDVAGDVAGTDAVAGDTAARDDGRRDGRDARPAGTGTLIDGCIYL